MESSCDSLKSLYGDFYYDELPLRNNPYEHWTRSGICKYVGKREKKENNINFYY